MHLIFGVTSSLVIWVVLLIHHKRRRTQGGEPARYCLVIETLGVVLVTLTGHLGGFLSGVNGPG